MSDSPDGELAGAPTGGLTRRALGGMKWTYGSTLATATLQIGYTAIMGRLLSDADFGLIAMAQVFLNFGQRFANAGVASALVQKPEVTRADIRVAVTSSTGLGLVFGGAVALAAPLAAELFGTPDVIPIVRLMAVALVVQAMGHTAVGLLERELRFRTLAIVGVAGHGIGYLAVGVTLALAGFGVWSLVAAAIASQALRTVIAYASARHAVVPLLRWTEFKALYGFGGRVSVIEFLEFLGANLDVMVIGRFGGQRALGQWNRASLLITLPFSYAINGLSGVLFPTFSRIQSDLRRVRRGYVGALRYTSALLIPAAAGMAAANDELVRVLLGPGWESAAAFLPWLALSGVAQILTTFGGIVCEAIAALNRKLLLQTGFLIVLAVGLLVVRSEPLIAMAVVVGVANLLRYIVYMLLMSHLIGVTAADHRDVHVAPLLTAVAVGGALHATSVLLGQADVAVPAVLVVQIVLGAGILIASLRWGPMAPVRRELRDRLTGAGLIVAGAAGMRGRAARLLGEDR